MGFLLPHGLSGYLYKVLPMFKNKALANGPKLEHPDNLKNPYLFRNKSRTVGVVQ